MIKCNDTLHSVVLLRINEMVLAQFNNIYYRRVAENAKERRAIIVFAILCGSAFKNYNSN